MGQRLHPASRRSKPNICDGLTVQPHFKAISADEAATGECLGSRAGESPSRDLALLLPSVYQLPDRQYPQASNLHIISQVA